MWLAEDDPIRAEHLERETMLTYFFLLNKKLTRPVSDPKRHNMKRSGSAGSNRTHTGRK